MTNTSFCRADRCKKWESIKCCLLFLHGKEKENSFSFLSLPPPLNIYLARLPLKILLWFLQSWWFWGCPVLLFTCFCPGLLLGVHSEAGGSGAGFVSHLPHPEDPHSPQAVPRLHAPGRPPPTALIPSKCYWCGVFTLQWSSRYQERRLSSLGHLLMA